MTGDVSDDVDADALRTESEEIKGSMGLAADHPYWWRFWIVGGSVSAPLCYRPVLAPGTFES